VGERAGTDAGARLGARHLEREPDPLDRENRRHVAGEDREEALEVRRLEQRQRRAVHLVHASDVVVGRRQHLAMGILQPVEPLLQPLDEDAAQIHDLAPVGPAVGGEQRLHQRLVLEDQVGVAEDERPDVGGFGGVGHAGISDMGASARRGYANDLTGRARTVLENCGSPARVLAGV